MKLREEDRQASRDLTDEWCSVAWEITAFRNNLESKNLDASVLMETLNNLRDRMVVFPKSVNHVAKVMEYTYGD